MRGVCRVSREVTITGPQSRPSVQTIHAEHESDFCFNLSNIIRLRVLLVPPHHLPSVVHLRVLPSISLHYSPFTMLTITPLSGCTVESCSPNFATLPTAAILVAATTLSTTATLMLIHSPLTAIVLWTVISLPSSSSCSSPSNLLIVHQRMLITHILCASQQLYCSEPDQFSSIWPMSSTPTHPRPLHLTPHLSTQSSSLPPTSHTQQPSLSSWRQ